MHVSGVRFSVGLAFDRGGSLYFTNNAHDSVAGDEPWDTLTLTLTLHPQPQVAGDEPWDTINRASPPSPSSTEAFGFPHCYVTADGTFNASAAPHLLSSYSSGVPSAYEDVGDHDA